MCHLHRLWFIGEMKGIYSTQKVSAPRILPRISPEEVALPLIIIYFIYMWFFSCHCHESSISWATRNGSVFSWSNFTCILGSPGFGLCEDTQLSTLLFPFSPWGYGALCWFLQNLCVHIISASSDLYCSSQWKPFYHVSLISALSTLTKH